jgi:hypothetical protein
MKHAIDKTYEQLLPDQIKTDQIAKKAKDVIDFFVPTFKHKGFEEEREWRMIFVPTQSGNIKRIKPCYRAARDMLIPYYSLKDLIKGVIQQQGLDAEKWAEKWHLPIKHVLIGPSRHKELNKASARFLLLDNGYYSCPVNTSETPYRG